MRSALVVLGVIALVAIGAVGMLVVRQRKPALPRGDTPAELGALQEEVARLRADVESAKHSARVALRTAVSAGAAPAFARDAGRPLTAEERAIQKQAARAAWYAAVDSQFSSEGTDSAWSPRATRDYQAMVSRHAEGAVLVSARCATTMCKVVVSHANVDQQREFSSDITQEPILDAEVMYKYDPDAQPPTTTMWISRKGHRLPRVRRN